MICGINHRPHQPHVATSCSRWSIIDRVSIIREC